MNKLSVFLSPEQNQPAMSPQSQQQEDGYLLITDYRSGSQPEVLAAYRKWGTACARHLSGDYAFVLWDMQQQRILAARSISGRCPLYIAQPPSGGIMCASDPSTLLAQGISAACDTRWLALWLVHGEDHWRFSPWRAIWPLLPGHSLIYEQGQMRTEVSWFPPARLRVDELSFEDAATCFRSLMIQAVNTRYQGQELITLDCSGGLDSSSIVAIMAYLQEQGEMAPCPLSVYHGYSEHYPEEDARLYVDALLARYPALQPHFINMDLLQAKPLEIPEIPYPALRSVLMPTFPLELERLLQAQGSTMHMTGAYGDHLFTPTIRSLWHEHPSRLPQQMWEWRQWRKPLALMYDAFLAECSSRKTKTLPALIEPEALRLAEESLSQHEEMMRGWMGDPFQRSLITELHRDQHILKIDGRMEENGIELGYPYLDQPIIEFLCQCPTPWLMAPGRQTRKALLREAMRGILPDLLRERADKGNATRVISAWGRQHYRELQNLTVGQVTLPFINQEALISAITRIGYGDCRDQRFVYHALALYAWKGGETSWKSSISDRSKN